MFWVRKKGVGQNFTWSNEALYMAIVPNDSQANGLSKTKYYYN